ncbi:MAG TPA: methyltransferase domain-containing protein [Conexibacter sp.]|jgi:ubiquinone/menaquinone biosynthesis C-methylase UbiE|nr:methyltransferase domain-containing protein [Conexibacter sp.]
MTTAQDSDPDELRGAVRERWERAAAGWRARNERLQAAAMPVSRWLVDAIEPQRGQRVLELAAGVGETGFLAAELIAPGGTLICSDGAEAMLAQARERAQQLGIANVEFALLELEWIDLTAASVDAAICRWGYMFALDRGAALRETRRVLRPGGRLALAAWSTPERNPFAATARRALVEAGLVDGFDLGAGPGMFDLADPAGLRTLLEDAGFADVVVEEVALTMRYDDVDDYIAGTCDLSPAFADVVAPLSERQRADLRERVAVATAPFAASDGALGLPGVALVAAADA